MFIKVALIVSTLFQFGAFFITASLIRKTFFNISWIAISLGFLLMAIRRLMELVHYIRSDVSFSYPLIYNWLAVFISILIFLAAIYIKRIFNKQFKLEKLRQDSENQILKAIIKTEENERQKFAAELHDGLGPILSSVKLAVSALDKNKIDGEKNIKIIGKTENSIDTAINSLREISNRLSPQILSRYGLEKAVRSFIDGIIVENSIKIQINSNIQNLRFDYDIELVIYRILGELLNNTLKYANATSIEISFIYRMEFLEVIYSDDGVGVDLDNLNSNGQGIPNLKSRVKPFSALLDMKSSRGKGFFVKVVFPVNIGSAENIEL